MHSAVYIFAFTIASNESVCVCVCVAVMAVPPPVLQGQRQESFKVKILRRSLCPYSPYAKTSTLAVNGEFN